MENRKYLIIGVSEVQFINFDEILETSFETLRFNSDKTKTFFKWDYEGFPSFIDNLLTAEGPYDIEHMKKILEKDEWN